MKFKALFLGVSLIVSSLVNASCFKTYQDNLAETKTWIKNSNYDEVMYQSGVLATSTNLVVISTLAGGPGGPLISTAAAGGLIASLYLASTYINLRQEDGVKEALAKEALLSNSIALLKEAKIGNGPILQDAILGINRSISTAISLKNLADKINDQSERLVYCQNHDQVMSPAGILQTAIDELKK
jgi:hypothetical protein